MKVHLSQGENQQLYSLVCVDPDKLAESLDKMKQLNARARAALKVRMKAEFKDLDKQLGK